MNAMKASIGQLNYRHIFKLMFSCDVLYFMFYVSYYYVLFTKIKYPTL